MEFSYEGIGQVVATFAAGEGVEPGVAVTMTGDCMVGIGNYGEPVCGKVLAVNDDCCAVQMGGFIKVHFTEETPTIGWNGIAVDGQGGVIVGLGTMMGQVVHIDEDEATVVIKI